MTSSLETRFWAKVQKTDTCWLWTGTQDGRGYGSIYGGPSLPKTLKVHRVSYDLHNEVPAPRNCDVMHSCDVRCCVNPAHLSIGTRSDNMKDAARKNRICTIGKSLLIVCAAVGHPLSGDNLIVNRKGHRRCKKCQLASQKRYYRRCHPLPEAILARP